MYKLNNDVICVEKFSGEIFLYNRKLRKKYLLNKELSPMIKSLINGIGIDEYKSYQLEFEQLYREGLISENVDNNRALYRVQRFKENLDTLQIEITKKCNFNCIHCYLRNVSDKIDMKISQLKSIIDQASEMGCINIDITGGESLLYVNLKEILQYIYNKGMKTTLYTNGYLINENWISFFKSINLDTVKISVDDIDETSHENIREGSKLDVILENIEKLLENDIKVEITTIVMKANVKTVDKTIEYFKKRNVIHFVDSYVPELVEMETDQNLISPFEYASILCSRCSGIGFQQLTKKKKYCGFAFNYLFIGSDGTIKLCPAMPNNLDIGHISQHDLSFYWNEIHDKYSELACEQKNDCEFYDNCAGGCRHRALVFSKKLNGKDPYMCKFYELMKENP